VNTVHLVEQATLGSLLVRPYAIRPISGWLRSDDFTDPWHRHVYAAIREHAAAGNPLWAARLGEVLTERLGATQANIPRIHDLMVATPMAPHPVVYARMVLDTSIREQTAAQGVLLRAGALAAAAGDPTVLRYCVGLVSGNLTAQERRWNTAFNQPTTTDPDVAPISAATGWRDAALRADRTVSQHPTLDQDTVCDHEQHLIATLATHPVAIGQVASWWRPDAVTNDTWRPVYAALVDLSDRGLPIDLVTVRWHIRSASRRWGDGPNLSDLREALDADTTTDPTHSAGLVAGDQVRRCADHVADLLRAAATNPGLDLADVLQTGRLAISTLTDLSQAISHINDLTSSTVPTHQSAARKVGRVSLPPRTTPVFSVVPASTVMTR
jgi:replicative DNA helicase